MTTQPLTAVDAAWYHIDGPVNLALVTGILFTKTPLDFEKVKAVYERRLARFPRFRQRVVERGFPVATPYWEDVPGFTIAQHLHHLALPAPRDHATLVSLVSDLASTPLDRSLPLWQIHVIDEVDGGSALVMRFHHCIGDGTAMMALSEVIFDTSADAPLGDLPGTPPPTEGDGEPRWATPAIHAFERTARTVLGSLDAALGAVRHPERVVEGAAALLDGAGALLAELLKAPDPASPIKGDFGMNKRVAWSEPVPLAAVKEIGTLLDAKVNDVLVAGLTGALRAFLAERGAPVDRSSLRAMVPVDLRPRHRALELGNEFGLVILDLAVGQPDPVERLRETKAHMDALKKSPEAVAIMTLFNIFGRTPKIVEDLAVDLFSARASLVLTNVAGPRHPLYLAGVPIERVMFWVPHPGKQLGMGVSILSYNGMVTLAVIADANLVPDPAAITTRFNAEFDELLARARAEAALAAVAKAKRKQPRRAPAARPRTATPRRRSARRSPENEQ
jgi:WS/DGAT/MGAT family acyltransferase